MRIGAALGWAILGGLVIVACGSSSSDGGGAARTCTPGASVACTGAGGCSGGQVCNESGTALGDCVCGAGTDGGPSSDASSDAPNTLPDSGPTWTPKSLSGLQLWVDGENFGDAGASIPDWPDQSGAGNDLTGSAGPAPRSSALGAFSAAKFVQGSSNELISPTIVANASPFMIAMVVKPGANCVSGSCGLFTFGAGYYDPGAYDSVDITLGAVKEDVNDSSDPEATATTSAPLTNAFHVIVFRRVATAGQIRVDGTVAATATNNINGLPSNSVLTLGSELGSSITNFFDGDIAEAVVQLNPSDADVTQLESYLKSKYGL